MSVKSLDWAFDSEVYSSAQKFVLVILANYCNEDGKAYPSVERICRMTCLSDQTVRAALDELERKEFIKDTGKKMGHTQRVKMYQLPDEAWGNTPEYQGITESNGNPMTIPCKSPVNTHEFGGQIRKPEARNRNQDFFSRDAGTEVRTARELNADKIYSIYPRKVARPKAIQIIAIKLKAFPFDLLMERTISFSKLWKGVTREDIQFCPHPTTWFNQERFNDDPSTWGRPKSTNSTNGHSKPCRQQPY